MRPYLLAGEWRQGTTPLAVTDPFTGEVIDEVPMGTWADLDEALTAAGSSFERTRKQNAGERARVLLDAAAGIKARREKLITTIVREGGKPWKYAASEVDRAVNTMTFAGSTPVGWHLKSLAPRARVTLELGGNAAAIVEPDADLAHAASRVTMGGFYQAGQSCVSVQRVLVHEAIYDEFMSGLLPQVKGLVTGNPMDPSTDVGPLIDQKALDRIDAWVADAVAGGARALTGAER